LPANEKIRKRYGPFDGLCILCNQVEDVQHIFFSCPLARFAWSALRGLLGVDWDPASFADLFAILQRFRRESKHILWMIFAA
jgi:hypothetical protein